MLKSASMTSRLLLLAIGIVAVLLMALMGVAGCAEWMQESAQNSVEEANAAAACAHRYAPGSQADQDAREAAKTAGDARAAADKASADRDSASKAAEDAR